MTDDASTGNAFDESIAATGWTAGTAEAYRLDRDSGLQALVAAAARLDVAADAGRVRHLHGGTEPFGWDDLLLAGSRLGLKARRVSFDPAWLTSAPAAILFDESRERFVAFLGSFAHGDGAPLLRFFDPVSDDTRLIGPEDTCARFGSTAVLLSRNERTAAEAAGGHPAFGLSWFTEPMGRYVRRFGWVIAASLVLQLFALISPLLFQTVIDRVLVSRSLQSLDVLAIGLLGIALFEPLTQYARGLIFAHMAGCLSSELSTRMFRHLIHLPVSYFRSRRAGDVVMRVREMDRVRSFVTGSTLILVIDLLFVVVFVGVMFAYSAALSGFVIGALALYLLIWLALSPALRRRAQREAEREADATAHLTEAVSGIETLKSLNAKRVFARDWEERLAASLRASFSATMLGTLGGGAIGLVQKLTAALLLWFGVRLVMRGDLTVGELVAFNMLAGHVTMPVLRLAGLWSDFQHVGVSLRRLSDILGSSPESLPSAAASSLERMAGSIEFRQVTFRYRDDGREVLRRLNLTVRPGEKVGITGSSGSGKSTLTKLVQRLYIPQSGQVLVDGLDLTLADPVTLRRQMGVVLQESFLFTGSIRANIAMGCPGVGEDRMREAARMAGADAFIESLPQGYDTEVGERGGLLSGGQRQRIALARALVADPRLVILDEATSALDYDTEAAILERLPDILKGRTALVIAHRLNALALCDRIVVMEHGEIVEQGTHQQLLAMKGRYERLWRMQNG
ncbi:MAG: type I secretion system permease/ATPase [Alphaproteobacteria bacterium]